MEEKMLVKTKARVGVFSIALAAYFPQCVGVEDDVRAQYAAFLKNFPEDIELVDAGMISSKEASEKAGELFKAKDVDIVFCQTLTYSVSSNMLPAVKDLDVPVVICNVQKVRCLDLENADVKSWLGEGFACGCPGEMVACLNRFGKRSAVLSGVLEGGDERLKADIGDWCKAAAVRSRFKNTNIAQIGRPYPGMMDFYIDETNLFRRLGAFTKMIDWEKMWVVADDITDEAAIKAKAQEIIDIYDIEGGANADDPEMIELAKYVIGFEKMCEQERIGFIASHYDGFAQGKAGVLDSMLIPAFSMLIKQGTACAVEGDIKSALAMGILKVIAGCGQLMELYSVDFNDDIVIIGHSGSGDADYSEKKPTMKVVKVFHGKTGGGYLTQYYPPIGDTTLLAITQDGDGNFKFVVAEGVVEDGPVLHTGDTNQRTRFSCGAVDFLNKWCEAGPTHHMAAASGRHINTILKVAKVLDVPVEIITK